MNLSYVGVRDQVGNDDTLEFRGHGLFGTPLGPVLPSAVDGSLNDTTGNAFSSTALPTSLSLGDFDGLTMQLQFQDPPGFPRVYASLTGVSVEVYACGDGVTVAGEECDDGNTSSGDLCDPWCLEQRCGNGIRQPPEQCDDGNTAEPDGCTAECLLPEPAAGLLLAVGALALLTARARRAAPSRGRVDRTSVIGPESVGDALPGGR